jgi:hypothetical protein
MAQDIQALMWLVALAVLVAVRLAILLAVRLLPQDKVALVV